MTVPTLVFSKDARLIPGLEAGDFRVFDNGNLQQVTLETSPAPVSVALAIQSNHDVREYLSFIVKAGSVIEGLLLGVSGEAAVITYSDDAAVIKPFETGEVQTVLNEIAASGRDAHMLDAGCLGLTLLRQRPPGRARFLILIGQPMDKGSTTSLQSLKEAAERENATVFAITLPEYGKAFVSDTFSLQGLSSTGDRGGFKASVDLGKLISVLNRSANAKIGADPFSVLTAATGGTQLYVRRQEEFERAISALGVELRSAYQLSYSPSSKEAGYHAIKVNVDVHGARVFSRPGYWRGSE